MFKWTGPTPPLRRKRPGMFSQTAMQPQPANDDVPQASPSAGADSVHDDAATSPSTSPSAAAEGNVASAAPEFTAAVPAQLLLLMISSIFRSHATCRTTPKKRSRGTDRRQTVRCWYSSMARAWARRCGLTRPATTMPPRTSSRPSRMPIAGDCVPPTTKFPADAHGLGRLQHGYHLLLLRICLSLAAMKYARDARGDRITDPSSQLGTYLYCQIVRRRTVIDTLATIPAQKGAYLTSLPKHPQFARLRDKLIALRARQRKKRR